MAIYYITELFPRRPAPQARTRKTLRIWCEGHLLSYNCVVRIAGYAINNRASGPENGCLYGTYAAEITGHDEPIRRRLVEIFNTLEELARGLPEGGGEGRRTSARLQVQRSRRLHPIVPAGSDPSLEGQAGHLPDHEVQARPLRQHLALTRIAISDIGLQSDRNVGP